MKNLKEKACAVEDKSLQPGSFPYIWNHIKHNNGAMFGLIFIIALIILSLLSPYIIPYDYSEVDMRSKCMLPCLQHPFGCDELGRDILIRVLYGARYTLSIGFISTFIAAIFGCIIGAIAGYFGGKVDNTIMRILDVVQAFPHLILAILAATVLGPGLWNCILALGIAGISGFARMMRANILTIRGQEYIEAAQSINCPTFVTILSHVVPNAISPIIVQISMGVAASGLQAASLSFLGLGVQPPTPEWGAMLSSARQFIRYYPHMVIIPGIFIMMTCISLNLLGDSIRDALDPKLKD